MVCGWRMRRGGAETGPDGEPPRHVRRLQFLERMGSCQVVHRGGTRRSCVSPRQPTRRKRLDHPQKHPRPHRMATTTPPRPRPTPHQHLPPPRTIPPQPRRRRRTRLTPSSQSHTPQRRTTINTESVRAWPEQTRHGGRSCGHMPWSPPVVTTACAPTARVRVWRRPRLGRTADASSSHGERGS